MEEEKKKCTSVFWKYFAIFLIVINIISWIASIITLSVYISNENKKVLCEPANCIRDENMIPCRREDCRTRTR